MTEFVDQLEKTLRICSVILITLFVTGIAFADDKKIATFNTESDADTHWFEVSKVIRDAGKVDIWLLQEVESEEVAARYAEATAAWGRKSYRYVVSESGTNSSPHRSNDHLVIIYNSSELRHVETVELHAIRSSPGVGALGEPRWGLRGALFVRLSDRKTGIEYYVGNVHLKCCENGESIRSHQVDMLLKWVDRADVPVVLGGDFNIPISPQSENGNPLSTAFSKLAGKMRWLRPSNPMTTQCNPDYNSMLDHFFLKADDNVDVHDVKILNPDPSYCEADTSGGADHRAVVGSFTFGG